LIPKFKKGDLVMFDMAEAFGGSHFKMRNNHYMNAGVVISAKYNYNTSLSGNQPTNFIYKVWWGKDKYTNEHECYLKLPK